MDFLRRYRKLIFSITLTVFLGSIFFAGGSYYMVQGLNTVATVNGKRISYEEFQKVLDRVLRNLREQDDSTPITSELIETKKQEVLRDIISEEVFMQIATKYGFDVSDKELAADIHRFPAFQKDGVFDQETYFRALFYALRSTPEEFEESRRRTILRTKLNQFIYSNVHITDSEIRHVYAAENNGNLKNFLEDREEFINTYTQKKASQIMNDWIKQINDETKVKTYLYRIEQRRQQQ